MNSRVRVLTRLVGCLLVGLSCCAGASVAGFSAGVAMQDGNNRHPNPKSGQPVTIAELVGFASEQLQVNNLFWCTQEPFYSKNLILYLQAQP